MKRLLFLAACMLAGCQTSPPPAPTTARPPAAREAFYLQPLPVQQAQVYGETVTGRFVSLADFEDVPTAGAERGVDQLKHFAIAPPQAGQLQYVVNITRTGAGAMQVDLPAASSLTFRSPFIHDFSRYTLLSLAIYSPAVRDDLVITLAGPGSTWTSLRQLVPAGWSTIMLDLARLARTGGFNLRQVDTVDLQFTSAQEAVSFNLDDIMLIDNARTIPNTPPGLELAKAGLDYTLKLPGWPEPVRLTQSDDGLWRLGEQDQPLIQLASPGEPLQGQREYLDALGSRRVGAVELLEVSPLRLRVRNTWYFPPQAGEWIDMEIRQIRWEYTFYPDGRWVTSVTLNNAGGNELAALRLSPPRPVAWSAGQISQELDLREFAEPVGVWAMLAAPQGPDGDAQKADFAQPPALKLLLGKPNAGKNADWAPGDVNHDGFDESQGCYYARASAGNCRVELRPAPSRPLIRPVIFVAGQWKGPVESNCQGLPLRPVVTLPDGVLAAIPDSLTAPAIIEFAGPVGALEE